ncbi:unnamed protein product [Vicia faba]|uniref:C2 domain-containing protein n=1 Tax=Vicia faba TaxID=3906 RepID=A0AAV1B8G6_VICFA|nr:unnamed protein product [Vicia faba]
MWGHQGDGTWLRLNWLVWWLHHAGLPAPSCELTHGTCAKALVLCLLDRRVLREAGFTEQRTLPTLDSGGITGCCTYKPQHQVLCLLDRRVLREAGFTEQRTLPTLDSGGITGCCTSKPQHQTGGYCVRLVSQSSEHFLLLTVEGSQAAAPPNHNTRRVLREAGFTEQRTLPTLDSGGITGCCTSKPQHQVLCLLDRRVLREAGFTEQRTLPTLDSGGITGCCTSKPQHQTGGYCVRLVSQSSEHFLLLTVEGSQAAAPPNHNTRFTCDVKLVYPMIRFTCDVKLVYPMIRFDYLEYTFRSIERPNSKKLDFCKIIPNCKNPLWDEHFVVLVAHPVQRVEFLVKDNDILGAELIGVVEIPVQKILSGSLAMSIHIIWSKLYHALPYSYDHFVGSNVHTFKYWLWAAGFYPLGLLIDL